MVIQMEKGRCGRRGVNWLACKINKIGYLNKKVIKIRMFKVKEMSFALLVILLHTCKH